MIPMARATRCDGTDGHCRRRRFLPAPFVLGTVEFPAVNRNKIGTPIQLTPAMKISQRRPSPRLYPVLLVLLATLLQVSGVSAEPAKPEDTEASAKAVVTELIKPGADVKTLSKQLQPTKADYDAVYEAAFAQKLREAYDPVWASGQAVFAAKPGQTEVLIDGVPTADIRQWTAKAQAILPGGYQKVSSYLKEGHTIYRFKFVAPGEKLGMAFDGLVFVNGHWCIIPKPWRVLES